MAVDTVAPQTVIYSAVWNELANLINGATGAGQPVKFYDFNSSSVFSTMFGNQDTTNGLISKFQYGAVGSPTEVARVTKNGIIGKLRDKAGWTFNLESYVPAGATINDASTNETVPANLAAADTAWAAAFADVAAVGGGTISVGPGTFLYWSPSVTPADNAVIRGTGSGTILKHRATSTTGTGELNLTGRSGFWICNLTIDGNYANTHGTVDGFADAEVSIQGGSDCGLMDVTIQNFNCYGAVVAGTRTAVIRCHVVGVGGTYSAANAFDSQVITNKDLKSVYGFLCPGSAVSTGLYMEDCSATLTRSAGFYVGGTNGLVVRPYADNCHRGYWPDDGGGTAPGIGNQQGGGMIATTFTYSALAPTGFTFLNPMVTGATGPAVTGIEVGGAAGVSIIDPVILGSGLTGGGIVLYSGTTLVRGGLVSGVTNTASGGIAISDGAHDITIDSVLIESNFHGIHVLHASGTAPTRLSFIGCTFTSNTANDTTEGAANIYLEAVPASYTSYGHHWVSGAALANRFEQETQIQGSVYIADTSNANVTRGLTINQLTADDQILNLKSSDVAHGITSITETDTYGYAQKSSATDGGLNLAGLTEVTTALQLLGFGVTDDTTQGAANLAYVTAYAAKKSGTTIAAAGATANIFGVSNGGNMEMLVTGGGDLYLDATTHTGAWDEHDDVALLEAYRVLTAPDVALDFRERFCQDVEAHADVLAQTGVISVADNGGIMVSTKGLNGLLIDSIRQMAGRVNRIEGQLSALTDGSSAVH